MHTSDHKPIASTWRLIQLASVVLLFHVAHSLLQEEVFHLPGFHHALLLSFLQTLCMSCFALADYIRQGCERKTPLRYFVALSILALVASFATNEASMRLNYPTQVIFKSSKLLAVMALRSVMMQYKGRLTAMDIASAVAVVVGLSAFTYATHQSKKLEAPADDHHSAAAVVKSTAEAIVTTIGDHIQQHHKPHQQIVEGASDFFIGVVAVVVAVAADALLYIVEEKYCFHTFGSSSGEIIVFLNGFAAANAGGALIVSGNAVEALRYVTATGVLLPLVLAYSLCNFVGTTAILSVVNEFGSPSAIIVTNTRKVLTILGSFLVYPKPFSVLHGLGLALVTGGVYAHELSRKKKAAPAPPTVDDDAGDASRLVKGGDTNAPSGTSVV